VTSFLRESARRLVPEIVRWWKYGALPAAADCMAASGGSALDLVQPVVAW